MTKPQDLSWPKIAWGYFISLFLLAFAPFGASAIKDAFVTGRTYSPGVVVGFSDYCYRSQTPISYWGFVGLYTCTLALMLVVAIWSLVETVNYTRRKLRATSL